MSSLMSPEQSYAAIISDELAADYTARFTEAEIQELAENHCRISQQRSSDEVICEMSLVNSRSFIHVSTVDMPFLIDSISGELNRKQSPIFQIIHPIVMVTRDEHGLKGVASVKTQGHDSDDTLPIPVASVGSVIESWSIFEVERTLDQERTEDIVKGIRAAIEDVKKAVADWKPMLAQLDDVIGSLDAIPHSANIVEQIPETKNLLEWLKDENYTFLGYREYTLANVEGENVLIPIEKTGLGLLRDHGQDVVHLTPVGRHKAAEKRLLIITKTNRRSTVHRNAYLDYVGVKTFDAQGNVTGERRFIGLFASSAYTSPTRSIPLISEKVREVMKRSGYTASSHSGKDLMTILETYPRDELFQMDVDDLENYSREIRLLSERRKTRVFLRYDMYGRYVSALVFLPRDRYNTHVRLRIQEQLAATFDVKSIDFETRVTDSALARLYFMIRLNTPVESLADTVDENELETRVARAVRSWGEGITHNLTKGTHDISAEQLAAKWSEAFPEGYKSYYEVKKSLTDIDVFEKFHAHTNNQVDQEQEIQHVIQWENSDEEGTDGRIRLLVDKPLTLSDIVPYLQHLGFTVTYEHPFTVTPTEGPQCYIYDLGVKFPEDVTDVNHDDVIDTISRVISAQTESDYYSRLVTYGGITERQVMLLRALSRYLRQVRPLHSYGLVGDTLVAHPEYVNALLEFFDATFNPEHVDELKAEAAKKKVLDALDQVSTLEADSVLRAIYEIVQGIVRTNFYQKDAQGYEKSYVSFKMTPRNISVVPEPRPLFEIFVFAPEVEGVHLRFDKIARGGLRWSDRREDFRTEILGLVKAQEVKNAVIVPSGAKGGFYVKNPVSMSDRGAWMTQGQECYKIFMRGLLDVTDNMYIDDAGADVVVPPHDVIRLDEDDPYLVVAADKGTASFSDLANSISAEYNFWLGDAFASGGSVGYDHKAMAITARGAWESAKHHFAALGKDIQKEDFTVVGIGDMSGDVFGNGMLLSRHTKLVAAFDHRDIFIDPHPDAEATFAERQRLFNLPRSSWQDFDKSLISEGGGIFPRTQKTIPLTPQIKEALGIDAGIVSMTPLELLRAILVAPVDMLFNGGIGTYVKASAEPQSAAADKANDTIRINGQDLRVKVVTEGGNLGLTQLGRIEAARQGIKINTDAIDNSAGVDCSDHEVNIKILLDRIVAQGELDTEGRNSLLAEMTDEVADLVLEDNVQQNILLSNDIFRINQHLPFYCRMMDELKTTDGLDRALEFLPGDSELLKRKNETYSLTTPEVSVLAAYAKIALTKSLLRSDFADDPWLEKMLMAYFPQQLQDQYSSHIQTHPLRKNIISTMAANLFINTVGVTSDFRLREETGCSSSDATKAFIIASEIFGIPQLVATINKLSATLDAKTYLQMHRNIERLLDRAMRRIIGNGNSLDIQSNLDRYQPIIADLSDDLVSLLGPSDRNRATARAQEWVEGGVPEKQAEEFALIMESFAFMDIADISVKQNVPALVVAKCYFILSEHYAMDNLRHHITSLPRENRWQTLARATMRDDLYSAVAQICTQIISELGPNSTMHDAEERLAQWEEINHEKLSQLKETFEEISALPEGDMAPLAVALRQLRNVIDH